MANFHSGAFYPLGFLYLLLGDVKGWDFLVILPSLATAATMYLYLRQIKVKKVGAVAGGVIYAYSGFAISWAQFVTAAHAMIWMPLILIVLEKFFDSKRTYYLYYLPLIFFLLITSGHFQIMVYITVLTVIYFVWKWMETKDYKLFLATIVPGLLTLGLAAFQMLPTLELTKYGLRSVENYIAGYNYGAKHYDRVKQSIMTATLTALAVSLVGYAFMMLVPTIAISMFTSETPLIESSARVLRIMVLFIPFAALQITGSTYFQAVGKGTQSLLLGLSRQFLLLIPIVLVLPLFIGVDGVWMAFPIADMVSTVLTAILLAREIGHLDRHITSASRLSVR